MSLTLSVVHDQGRKVFKDPFDERTNDERYTRQLEGVMSVSGTSNSDMVLLRESETIRKIDSYTWMIE